MAPKCPKIVQWQTPTNRGKYDAPPQSSVYI